MNLGFLYAYFIFYQVVGGGIPYIIRKFSSKTDIFGNKITNPCLGNDGGIYDLSSMEFIFETDNNGKYENLKYVFDKNGNKVPDFPLLFNNTFLSSFRQLKE